MEHSLQLTNLYKKTKIQILSVLIVLVKDLLFRLDIIRICENGCKIKTKENIDLVKLSETMRMQNAMGVFSHAVVIARGDLDKDNELCLTTTCTSKDKHIEEVWRMM